MYPDEDMRSIVYRYRAWHICAGTKFKSSDISWLIKELFDINSSCLSKMPHNLEYLCSNLPPNTVSVDELIYEHTLFPLEESFSSSRRSSALMANIKRSKSESTSYEQVNAGAFISSEIRCCPKCLEEDLAQYGECYIHRVHQLRNIDVCSKHGVYLVTRCLVCNEQVATPRGSFDMHNAFCNNGHDLRLQIRQIAQNDDNQILKMQILHDIEYILKQYKLFTTDNIRMLYQGYLETRQIVTLSGRCRSKKFVDMFLSNFPKNTLDELGIPLYNIQNYLPQGLIDPAIEIKNSLLINILVMRMFAGSVKDFVTNRTLMLESEIPFGNGPWRCMNKVCFQYEQPIILSCTRGNVRVASIWHIRAIFICPECGFTYVLHWRDGNKTGKVKVINYGALWERILIDTFEKTGSVNKTAEKLGVKSEAAHTHIVRLSKDDPFKVSSAVSSLFSVEWIQKLLEVYEKTQSLSATARHLGTTRPVVRRISQAIARSLIEGKDSIVTIQEVASTYSELDRHEEAKREILSVLQENKDISRGELRRRTYKHYAWLQRHDREWLDSVLPSICHSGFKEIDWNVLDEETKEIVKKTAKALYDENPRKQIKDHTIRQELPPLERGRIGNGPTKMPKTISCLQELAESREAFHLRFISHAIEILKERGRTVNVKNVLSMYQFQVCSDLVKNQVEEVLLSRGYPLK